MVVCKFYPLGNCRYGQSCRFEHVNSYGGQNDRNKPFSESKSFCLTVAEEVLSVERGGQWILSCFSPGKDLPAIQGMDDVSPEEVRWEMYQAQKSGTVEQTKLQFQQLCQAMTAKREELKNPTQETLAMLNNLQKTNKDSGFGNTSFATTSPFGGAGFTLTNSSSTSSSIFNNATNTNSSSVFRGNPSFGGAPVFGNQAQPTNSIFGGGTMSTLNTAGQQSSSVFGGGTNSTQSSIFGQTAPATTQPNSIFSSNQSPSVFGGNTLSTPSPFSNAQTTNSPFGGVSQSSESIFGGATTITPVNSIFGSSQGAPVSSTNGSSSIFGAPKASVGFGAPPVFGGTASFNSTQPQQAFPSQSTFSSSGNVFGSNTTTSTFGSNPGGTNSFAALAAPAQNAFPQNSNQNTGFSAFGNAMSSNTTAASPFAAAQGTSSGFGAFGGNTNAPGLFSTAQGTSSNNQGNSNFGGNVFGGSGGYGSAPTYASTPSTPFASTTTTPSISNPFAQKAQQMSSSLGVTASGTTFGGMSAGPFGSSSFGNTNNENMDQNIYSAESDLTDEEKQMYAGDQFELGKIPMNPPTVELR